MQRPVLVFTRLRDSHVDRLRSEFDKIGAQAISIPYENFNDYQFEVDGDDLIVVGPEIELNAREAAAVFIRVLPSSDIFGVHRSFGDVSPEDFVAIQREAAFHDWLNTLASRVPVYNEPLAAYRCMGKVYQRAIAQSVGLACPDEYVGAVPAKARAFVRKIRAAGQEVCTKPVAQKSVLIGENRLTRYTEKLPPQRESELDSLNGCPLIFQGYLDKDYELRITVADNLIFACRISSQEAGGDTAVDWRRYNIPRTPHHPYPLPDAIAERLLAFHARTGLRFSSFDLVRTRSGEYVFLETNPFGQWLWIEDFTGLEITKGLASVLAQGTRRG